MRKFLCVGLASALVAFACGKPPTVEPEPGGTGGGAGGGAAGGGAGGGTSGDTTPPAVTSSVPAAGAVDVAPNSVVTLVFSEALDPATVSAATVGISPATGAVSYEASTNAIVIAVSSQGFSEATTVTVSTGVKDVAGNALPQPFSLSYTTAAQVDTTPPTVIASTPSSGATGVARDTVVTVVFGEAMAASTITAANIAIDNVTSAVTYDATTKTATLTPAALLPYGSAMTLRVKSGVTDLAGNALAAEYVAVFNTVAQDVTPPTVTTTSPASGAYNVSRTPSILITFSEAMDASTIVVANFSVSFASVNVTYDAANNRATVTPATTLPNNATITVNVMTGVKDAAGNALASAYAFTFRTKNSGAPAVVSTTPSNGAIAVSRTSPISVRFNETLNVATVIAANLYCDNATATVTYDDTNNISTATLTPTTQWPNATAVNCHATTALQDLDGTALTTQFNWSFSTTDTVGPTVTTNVPANNATTVKAGDAVTVTFDEAVDGSTINPASFSVAGVAGAVTYDAATRTASWRPTAGMTSNASYTATVAATVRDVAGNPMAAAYSWSYTLENDVTAPTVTGSTPSNGATGVLKATPAIEVDFSEELNATTVTASTLTCTRTLAAVTTTQAGTVSYSLRRARFVPTGGFAHDATYSCTVSTGVTDVVGNALAAAFTFSFTVQTDVIPPTVASTTPAAYSHFVPTSTNSILIAFDEPVTATSVTTTNITVSGLTGTITYDSTTMTATFTPATALAPGAHYTVRVNNVRDVKGNMMTTPYSGSFRTAGAAARISGDTAPQLTPAQVLTTTTGAMHLTVAANSIFNRKLFWHYFTNGTWTHGELGSWVPFAGAFTELLNAAAFGDKVAVQWRDAQGVVQFKVFSAGAWSSATAPASDAQLVGGPTKLWSFTTSGTAIVASSFDGTSWSTPQTVSSSGTLFTLAANATGAMVGYHKPATSPANSTDFYAAVHDGTGWTEQKVFTGLTANGVVRSAAIANASGYCFALWHGTTFNVSTFAAGTWSVHPIALSGTDFSSFSLATNGTGYAFAFMQVAQGTPYANVMVKDGTSWSSPNQLGVGRGNVRVASNGSGYMAAMDYAIEIRAAEWTSASPTWTQSAIATASLATLADLVFAGGRYAATWVTGGGGAANAVVHSNGWQPSVRLDSAGISGAPMIGVAGSSFVVSFLEASTSGTLTARSSATGATFDAAVAVPHPVYSGEADSPDIAIGQDGKALAVWEQYERGSTAVFARPFDGASWGTIVRIAPSGGIPRVASNGSRWVVVFRGANSYPQLVTWTEAGGFTTAVTLANGRTRGVAVTAAANGDFFALYNGQNANVFGRHGANGTSWTSQETVDNGGVVATLPNIVAVDDGFVASYGGPNGTTYFRKRSSLTVPPATWSAANIVFSLCDGARAGTSLAGVCFTNGMPSAVSGLVGNALTTFGSASGPANSRHNAASGKSGAVRVIYPGYTRDFTTTWSSAIAVPGTLNPAALAFDGLRYFALGRTATAWEILIENTANGFAYAAPFGAGPFASTTAVLAPGNAALGGLVLKDANGILEVWGSVF